MIDHRSDSRIPSWAVGAAQSLLRVVAAAVYMEHGLQKLVGLFADPRMPWKGPPGMFSQFWFGGVIETFGGLLLLIGLFTRPVALLLCGELAVVYFQFHAPRNFAPIMNGGEAVVMFCFGFLFFSVAGGGPYSVDALLRGRRGISTRA